MTSKNYSDAAHGVTGQKPASKTEPAAAGMWKRSDGTSVEMAGMNPYYRSAALKKAEAAGDTATAEALRASGPLPE